MKNNTYPQRPGTLAYISYIYIYCMYIYHKSQHINTINFSHNVYITHTHNIYIYTYRTIPYHTIPYHTIPYPYIYIYTYIHIHTPQRLPFLNPSWVCRTSETKVLATVSPLMMVCTSPACCARAPKAPGRQRGICSGKKHGFDGILIGFWLD